MIRKMMVPLVSIIVPIYNVEKYLNKCVDSILNQTLKNIEVILVNDGSVDNCGKIVDEYKKKDKRVKVIHKENGGQSSARNMGLDIAQGKYIGFIDSDDSIHLDMYENLYNAIESSSADICVCGRESYFEDRDSYCKIELLDELIDLTQCPIQDYISKKMLYKHTVSSCNKIYRKDIISKNNIKFKDVNYVGSEDTLFNYEVLLHINKIRSVDKIGYIQFSRIDSTARKYKYGYMNRTANMIKCMYDYSKKIDALSKYEIIGPIFLLFFYQWNMSNIKSVNSNDINTLILNEIKDASNNKEFMKCIRQLAFDRNSNYNIKNMGFGVKGIVFIKTIMVLYYFRLYKIMTKIILLK